jgi:hypothetical protein
LYKNSLYKNSKKTTISNDELAQFHPRERIFRPHPIIVYAAEFRERYQLTTDLFDTLLALLEPIIGLLEPIMMACAFLHNFLINNGDNIGDFLQYGPGNNYVPQVYDGPHHPNLRLQFQVASFNHVNNL